MARKPATNARALGKAGGTFVALLRGINVGGHKRIPMLELCRLASEVGVSRTSGATCRAAIWCSGRRSTRRLSKRRSKARSNATLWIDFRPGVARSKLTPSVLLSALGLYAGRRFGAVLGSRLEAVGGLVLIGLGVKRGAPIPAISA